MDSLKCFFLVKAEKDLNAVRLGIMFPSCKPSINVKFVFTALEILVD